MNFVPKICYQLIFALLLASLSQPLFAHGGGTPRLTSAEAGPYQVYAWSDPEPWRVGEVHLSLAITKRNPEAGVANIPQELPVTDVDVTITLTPLDGNSVPITVQATHPQSLSDYYFEVETQVASEGEWEVTIEVGGPEGAGSTGFTLAVESPHTINWFMVSAGVTGVIVLVGLWSRYRQPVAPSRRPRRRGQHLILSTHKGARLRAPQRKNRREQ